ncbi:MAG: hypothetical protein WAM92_16210 [Mycobacterium sp.]
MSISLIPQRAPHAPEDDAGPVRPKRSLDAVFVAVLAAGVSLAGAARPSLWFDEAATISASTRPLTELWQMLGRVDAVHGFYYLLMHGWFAVAPATEFWCRVPSALAVGGAAAGVVVLTTRFSSRPVAVCAGVVFAILPRTTWAGIEARSYAFSALAAVWLTVLLVAAVRHRSARLWLLYGVGLLLAVLLNLNLALLIAVYAAVVAVLKPAKSQFIWWLATTAAVAAAVIPFAAFAHGQVRQVGWIFRLGSRTFGDVLVQQYFDDSMWFALAAGSAIVLAVAFWCRGIRRPDRNALQLLLIALSWIAIPTATLLIYSALLEPIYYPRYLYFTAPAAAIVLAACITTIAAKPVAIAGLVIALAATGVPNYLFVQRGPYAKEGMDYSQIADLIGSHAADGDCLVLDHTTAWAPGPIRPLTAARPAVYRRLNDPGRGASAGQRHLLWDYNLHIEAFAKRLTACRVIWTVTDRDKTRPEHERGHSVPPGQRLGRAPAYQIPGRMGFRIVERWQFNFAQVTESTR